MKCFANNYVSHGVFLWKCTGKILKIPTPQKIAVIILKI